MKKGIFISFDLKRLSVIFFSSILVASCAAGIHYSTISVATSNIIGQRQVIIVDAGHGDIDGGAQSSSGMLEKDINLSIANKVGTMLTTMGYDVVYTRQTDSIPYDDECKTIRQKKVWDTHNRMSVIEKHNGGIFLSIHQNYFTDARYSGAQVFYSQNNSESRIIAESIQNSIAKSFQKDNDRQIKSVGTEIYLLYHSQIPAVMVECGFLSNEKEASLLSDEAYQTEMALAIVKGLIKYLENETPI